MDDIPKVEFVNREEAEAHAARALALMGAAEDAILQSHAANLDACFELQAVANLVGPQSNTGVLGVHWGRRGDRRFQYNIKASCADGRVGTSVLTKASSEEEARDPVLLAPAIAALERLVAKNGGRIERGKRNDNVAIALIAAISSTPTGAAWIASRGSHRDMLLEMVRIADDYGREGVFPGAALATHTIFRRFPDRGRLVRETPRVDQAKRRAREIRLANGATERTPRRRVPVAARETLMRRAGLTPEAAQALLSLLLNGETSMLALKRAVKSLPAIVDDIDAGERKAA